MSLNLTSRDLRISISFVFINMMSLSFDLTYSSLPSSLAEIFKRSSGYADSAVKWSSRPLWNQKIGGLNPARVIGGCNAFSLVYRG